MSTCAMYMRDPKRAAPGNGPPQTSMARLAPTNGTECATQ